jgi:hypothetical protein
MSYRRLKIFPFEFNELAASFWNAEVDSSQWEILRQRSTERSRDVEAGFLIVRLARGIKPVHWRTRSQSVRRTHSPRR